MTKTDRPLKFQFFQNFILIYNKNQEAFEIMKMIYGRFFFCSWFNALFIQENMYKNFKNFKKVKKLNLFF